MKYKSIEIIIEAFQMTKSRRLDNSEWPNWLNQSSQKSITDKWSLFCANDGSLDGQQFTPIFINTPKGVIKVDWDDYIIKQSSAKEEILLICKPDIFEASYEKVD